MAKFVPYVEAIQYDGTNAGDIADMIDSTHPGYAATTYTGTDPCSFSVNPGDIDQQNFDVSADQWVVSGAGPVDVRDDADFQLRYIPDPS